MGPCVEKVLDNIGVALLDARAPDGEVWMSLDRMDWMSPITSSVRTVQLPIRQVHITRPRIDIGTMCAESADCARLIGGNGCH